MGIMDKYGRAENSAHFRLGEKEPYTIEEDTSTGTTFICYDNSTNRVVKRIRETTVGTVTTTIVELGYGTWANRAALTYRPINADLSV